MDISVAILPGALKGLTPGHYLDALRSQESPPRKIFVVADRPKEPEEDTDGPEIEFLKGDPRRPEAAARKIVSAVQADLLAFIDCPIRIPGNDWLTRLVKAFENDAVGAVNVPLVIDRKEHVGATTALYEAAAGTARCKMPSKTRKVDMLSSHVWVVRRQFLEESGLLKSDKSFDPAHISGELRAFSYAILWHPKAKVTVVAEDVSVSRTGLWPAARDRGKLSAELMRGYSTDDGTAGLALSILAVLLIPVCLVSLPLYVLAIIPIFFAGWWVFARFPLVPLEFPLGAVHLIVYAACLALMKTRPLQSRIPIDVHPAVIRHYVKPVAMLLTLCCVTADLWIRLFAAAARQRCRRNEWPVLAMLSIRWLLTEAWAFLCRSAQIYIGLIVNFAKSGTDGKTAKATPTSASRPAGKGNTH